MANDLYFMPMLARAVREPDARNALRMAFREIVRLAPDPRYRRGFAQFRQFMDAAVGHTGSAELALPGDDIVRELVLELATGTFGGDRAEEKAALALIRSMPQWQREFEEITADVEFTSAPTPPAAIVVTRDGQTIATILFERVPSIRPITNVAPGHYALTLDTGRLVWEGTLAERDVLWPIAFPDRPLDLAADTGETQRRPTVQKTLLEGELVLRVFPGLEGARLELEMRRLEVE